MRVGERQRTMGCIAGCKVYNDFKSLPWMVNDMSDSTTKQYLENLADERNTAALYRTLGEIEQNPKIAEVYRRLAATEEAHAGVWADKLKAANVAVPPFKPTWRTRTLMWSARRFGPNAALSSLSGQENRGPTTKQQ